MFFKDILKLLSVLAWYPIYWVVLFIYYCWRLFMWICFFMMVTSFFLLFFWMPYPKLCFVFYYFFSKFPFLDFSSIDPMFISNVGLMFFVMYIMKFFYSFLILYKFYHFDKSLRFSLSYFWLFLGQDMKFSYLFMSSSVLIEMFILSFFLFIITLICFIHMYSALYIF